MSTHPIDIAVNILTKKISTTSSGTSENGFEVFYSKSRSTKIDSKDFKVDSLTSASDSGLSFRIQKKGRVGFSYTTSIEPSSIESAIEDALSISEHMPEDAHKHLTPFTADSHSNKTSNPNLFNRFDEKGLLIPIEEKIKIAIELERKCKALDQRIKAVRSATFSESEGEAILVNHFGQRLTSRQTHFSSQIYCKAEENGDAQMGGDYQFSNHFNDLPLDLTVKNSVEAATELLGASIPTTRNCPAIIRNDVVADLLDFLSQSFFGEEIQKGRSMLKIEQLNEKIFSDKCSMIDDGLLNKGYSSRLFDAEGTKSQTTALIEKGVLRKLLLDKSSASTLNTTPLNTAHLNATKLNLSSTGNASRSIMSPPSLSITNLSMLPGTDSFHSLLKKMNNGIIITGLMGVHTANAITGAFSLGATGVLVENGIAVKPVKGFAVAGNALELFKNLTDIGSDLRFFGNLGAPSILLPELSISGA